MRLHTLRGKAREQSREESGSGTETEREQRQERGPEAVAAGGRDAGSRPEGGSSAGRARRVALGGALAVSVVLCALAGWSYADARTDDRLERARQRDAVLEAATEGITMLTSLDASTKDHIDKGVRDWQAAAIGPLRTELGRAEPETGPVTRGEVTAAAVTALDTRAGTAKVLATVQVATSGEGARPGKDRKRLEAVLERTPDGWKLRALGAVPVSGAEQAARPGAGDDKGGEGGKADEREGDKR